MPRSDTRSTASTPIHAQLERSLRALLLLGLALVVLIPAARGYSQWLGWMPLWLVAMPATAWWSSQRFRLPARALAVRAAWLQGRRRRPGPQARRRGSAVVRLQRAA